MKNHQQNPKGPSSFKRLFLGAALVPVLLVLTGCPSPQQKRPKTTMKTVLMGDPQKVYEGAKTNPHMDLSVFEDGETVYLFAPYSFQQKDTYNASKKITKEAIEEENAATKEDETEVDSTKTVGTEFLVKVDKDKKEVQLKFTSPTGNPNEDFLMIFTQDATSVGTLVYTREDRHPVAVADLIHFSATSDKRFFSLMLGVDDDESGRQVYVFYFSKDVKYKKPEKLNKWFSYENKQYEFYYTMGPGALIGFPKDETLRLDICGQTAREYSGFIKQAANQWANALKGNLDVKVREPETFFPFSDLNQHCVVLIDDYLSEPNPQSGNYGLTFNIIDMGKAEKIDADVLLFTEEFLKGYKDVIPGIVFDQIARSGYQQQSDVNPFVYTLVHELGHFFGLDHQFDGVPSMMSYEFSAPVLTDYDKEAVRLLYEDQNRVASNQKESDVEGASDASKASGLSETNTPSGLHGRPE